MGKPKNIYFVDRGRDRPEHHEAPYHRYLLCTNLRRAYWEAGWSGEQAWVWTRPPQEDGCGWLLLRWNGLDVDYGDLVRSCVLPDGTRTGFVHPHTGNPPWNLLELAVWWSDKEIPAWLAKKGISIPGDNFSRERMAEPLGFYLRVPRNWSGQSLVRPTESVFEQTELGE